VNSLLRTVLSGARNYLLSISNAYSVILFSDSHLFGLLLLAITMLSPVVGFSGLIGVLVTLLVSRLTGFDIWESRSGVLAFNSLLVCLAFAYVVPVEWISQNQLLYVGILSLLSIITLFSNILLNWLTYRLFNLPSMSLTFSLISVIIWMLLGQFGTFHAMHVDKALLVNWFPALPAFWTGYFHSMGSLIFMPYTFIGITIAVILIYISRLGFLLTLGGWTVSYLLMRFLGLEIYDGISYQGFNLILVFLALGGVFLVADLTAWLYALLAAVVAFFVSLLLPQLNPYYAPPVFALPFNITVILLLFVLKLRIKTASPHFNELLVSTPEKGLEYYLTRIRRFGTPGIPQFILPISGEWLVTQGPHGKVTHKDQWSHAWDFEMQDTQGLRFKENPLNLNDYYAFGKPVFASASGYVARILSGIPDNQIDNINTRDNWGNYVILSHGYGLYSMCAHLKDNSIVLKVGDYVTQGTRIGLVGNSGRSPRPHLHFQVQLGAEPGSRTRQCHFVNYKVLTRVDNFEFINTGIPGQEQFISPLIPNYKLQEILQLIYQQQQHFEVKSRQRSFRETWQVDLDLLGVHRLVSSRGSKLEFSVYAGIYNALQFSKRRNNALTAFAVLVSRLPYAEKQNLAWHDTPGLSVVYSDFIRNLILFIAPLINPFTAHTTSSVVEKDRMLHIQSNTVLRCLGIKYLTWSGSVDIEINVGVKHLSFYQNKHLILQANRLPDNT